MDAEQKAAEEARRERHWDPAVRWRVLQETITWAEAQGTVTRHTRSARLAEQRRKLAWLEAQRAGAMRMAGGAAEDEAGVAERKREIRERAHDNRRSQEDKDRVSREILAKVRSLPEYRAAGTVMFYVGMRDEVRTRPDMMEALAEGKRVVVPYCSAGELKLFHLECQEELEAGMLGILEPRQELRRFAAKHVDVSQIDLMIVPGVAFDRRGGRTGHGKGYYDKLLAHARPDTALVAVAFECQLFPEVPMAEHDVFMDLVVSENKIYRGQRSPGR